MCQQKRSAGSAVLLPAKSPLGIMALPCLESGEARCLLPALRQRKDVVGAAETGSEPDGG